VTDEELTEGHRSLRRILGDVGDNVSKIAAGGWRERYLITHDGSSRSISSMETRSPRSISASPWRTAATNSISRATSCKETSSGNFWSRSWTICFVLMTTVCRPQRVPSSLGFQRYGNRTSRPPVPASSIAPNRSSPRRSRSSCRCRSANGSGSNTRTTPAPAPRRQSDHRREHPHRPSAGAPAMTCGVAGRWHFWRNRRK